MNYNNLTFDASAIEFSFKNHFYNSFRNRWVLQHWQDIFKKIYILPKCLDYFMAKLSKLS